MSEPPIPTIAGMLSSIGPTAVRCGSAPSETARSNAAAASCTRNAIAHTEGPCACANFWPNESGSALMMKLMSPWECRVTFLLRWRATTGNPRRSNRPRSSCGSGAVYSTNSKPSVPMGFMERGFIMELAAIAGLRKEIDLVSIVTNAATSKTPLGEISPLPPVGAVQHGQFRHRGGLFRQFRVVDPRMAGHGDSRGESGAFGRRGDGADCHGQGGGVARGGHAAGGRPAAPHNRSGRPPSNPPGTHSGGRRGLFPGGTDGARVRTQTGGATLPARPGHARPNPARIARSRGRAGTGARRLTVTHAPV